MFAFMQFYVSISHHPHFAFDPSRFIVGPSRKIQKRRVTEQQFGSPIVVLTPLNNKAGMTMTSIY